MYVCAYMHVYVHICVLIYVWMCLCECMFTVRTGKYTSIDIHSLLMHDSLPTKEAKFEQGWTNSVLSTKFLSKSVFSNIWSLYFERIKSIQINRISGKFGDRFSLSNKLCSFVLKFNLFCWQWLVLWMGNRICIINNPQTMKNRSPIGHTVPDIML